MYSHNVEKISNATGCNKGEREKHLYNGQKWEEYFFALVNTISYNMMAHNLIDYIYT